MGQLHITGGIVPHGSVKVSGNKNAALPMLAASLLTKETVTIHNMPDILDVRAMLDIAGELGAEFTFENNTLRFRCSKVKTTVISKELCSKNRTSILFASSLVGRCGQAELYPPGGDVIGRRRLDGHFYGLTKLGAEMAPDTATYKFNASGADSIAHKRCTAKRLSGSSRERKRKFKSFYSAFRILRKHFFFCHHYFSSFSISSVSAEKISSGICVSRL
jgi:UDP-N-acetylglucosamine enolpyruvyl transferase